MPQTHLLRRVRIWDLPTRAFHVLLILAILGLFVTGEMGTNALPFHFWLGYIVLALVFFRLFWGVVGGYWSRFMNFVPSFSSLLAYLHTRQRLTHSVGHNPLGALSVLGMLGALLLQVFSGFMSDDEIANLGPWSTRLPSHWVSLATKYHSDVGKVVLISLIALHISTVLYYKHMKKEDLIAPMLHGDKWLPNRVCESRDTFVSRLFALSILMACAYLVYCLATIS